MTMRSRLNWLGMAGLAVVLASILVLLYSRTQGHDESNYFENVALLRQLKQLDARWELDVLKSKMGIDMNYDSLVDPLLDLHELQERLQTIVAHQQQDGGDALAIPSEEFHRAIEEKTRLIEHFKSHNSVLRNSLAFLPTAADDTQQAIRTAPGDGDLLRGSAADVNALLLDSIVFSQAPSSDRAADIQGVLERLSAAKGRLPATVRDSLDIFVSHVRTVLREQPEVNELLAGIAAVPTAVRIDALDNILSSEQREAQRQAQGYRRYLLIFATALAGLFLYAAVSLIRSHAVINSVNTELKRANETLEERVQERTRELHEIQGKLVTTARQAGMAEIANNVLHNVGNVLTSVNVSARLVDSTLRDSKSQSLAKAARLMNDHVSDLGHFMTVDKKGKMLPGYLKDLSVALEEERQTMSDQLGILTKSVDHIKEIVANQRSYSGSTTIIESVQVKDLLEDALRMKASSIVRHQVTVVKDFADVPKMLVDKHLILQILVNLIANATHAMDGVMDRARQMTLRLVVAETGNALRLRIRVEDNGEGIAPENLIRLFAHGFTTRREGHGFGLHSCALAAEQMEGTITAASDGPGRGAAFTLELPIRSAVYQS